jgi:hypothetical protein
MTNVTSQIFSIEFLLCIMSSFITFQFVKMIVLFSIKDSNIFFQTSIIVNRPNCHETNFCSDLISAKWGSDGFTELQEIPRFFVLLFNYLEA